MNLLSRSPWYEYLGPSESLIRGSWNWSLLPSRIPVSTKQLSWLEIQLSAPFEGRGSGGQRGDSSDAVSGSSFPPLGPRSECVSSRAERLKASHFTGETGPEMARATCWLLLPKIALFPRHAVTLHRFLSFLILLFLDNTLFVYQ